MVSAARDPVEATVGRRTYRSQLRAQQRTETRRAVLDAARQLFEANGWAETSMRDLAAAAGVSVETIYSHFSSKGGVLRAVADTAVVGDDAPVPLAERPEFRAIGRGRRAARLAVHARTAPIAKLLRQAAPGDDEIIQMLTSARERQRADIADAMALILGRSPTPRERDGVWALASPELYLLLVEESGWTPDEYEAWIAEALQRIVPRA
jgi:AcrR family transcriptional regulator